jgi:hypothetical protein
VTILRTPKAGAKPALAAILAAFSLSVAGLAPADARPAKGKPAHAAAEAKPGKGAVVAKAKAATKAAAAETGSTRPVDQDDADPEAIAEKRTPHYTSESGVDEGVPTQEGCVRPRKRLWVEGEGWIVRRVTVCR